MHAEQTLATSRNPLHVSSKLTCKRAFSLEFKRLKLCEQIEMLQQERAISMKLQKRLITVLQKLHPSTQIRKPDFSHPNSNIKQFSFRRLAPSGISLTQQIVFLKNGTLHSGKTCLITVLFVLFILFLFRGSCCLSTQTKPLAQN